MGNQKSYEEAEIVIVPVPYENKVSWGKGTKNGPKAVLEASMELENFSTYFNEEINSKVNIHTSDALEVKGKGYEDMIALVQGTVNAILEDGKKFVLIGGEHSISIGAVNSIANREEEFSILHLDAHSDLRDEFLGSKYNHGCVMRRALEKTENMVTVGMRSCSKESFELIEKNSLNVYGTEFENKEVLKKLKRKVYVTIDLDSFDPSEVPAVGTPQPGGLKWKQVLSLLKEVGEKKEIVGFDVVELSPITGNKVSDFLAAKLIYNLIGYSYSERFK